MKNLCLCWADCPDSVQGFKNDNKNISFHLTSCEVLTVEQLAERLQVSRATIFNWMLKGILAQGKHYFKRGHILRFIWTVELIQELLKDSDENAENRTSGKPSPVTLNKEKTSPINWEY